MADDQQNNCVEKLQSMGLLPVCGSLSIEGYCAEIDPLNPVIHEYCMQGPPCAPVQALACINYDNGVITDFKYFPMDKVITDCQAMTPQKGTGSTGWTIGNCYCCCGGCGHYGRVGVTGGMVSADELKSGAEVRTASISAGGAPQWSSAAVSFSGGVAADADADAVYIAYGDGLDTFADPDRPYLLVGGAIVPARQLQLGDALVGEDGQALLIHVIGTGPSPVGRQQLAVDRAWSGSADGHLLLIDGAVVGDFTLQMNLADLGRTEPARPRPEVGSGAHDALHPRHAPSDVRLAIGSSGGAEAAPFRLLMPAQRRGTKSAALFTPEQAADIQANGQQLPLSNPVPKTEMTNIMTILGAFYPGITFTLDWYDLDTNVHAIEDEGSKIVTMSGGFARLVGLGYEGRMMAMADGLSRFIGGPPTNKDGFSGTGAADHYAFGLVSRQIWMTHWIDFVMPAYEQFKAIFALVDPKHAGGDPKDPVEFPSLACRATAIETGIAGGGVPECAGGMPSPTPTPTPTPAPTPTPTPTRSRRRG